MADHDLENLTYYTENGDKLRIIKKVESVKISV
jgi:hypothetical protein